MKLAISQLDLFVLLFYLVGVVLFGVWMGRGQRGMADYLLGGRNIPWWLVLLSIVATETSTATFLSVPGVAFKGDLTFLQLAFGYIVGRYVVVAIFLPQYFRGELYTAYQVLDRRFGGATKQAASLLFMITRSLADGLRLLLAAIVLKVLLFPPAPASGPDLVLGLDPHLSLAVLVVGCTTIAYTFFGGIRAVVWTDFVQFFIYMLGALLAAVVILRALPEGFASLWEFGQQHEKLRVFDFRWDLRVEYSFWAGLVGGAFLSLGSHGADQLMVQRYLSARSQRAAAWALGLSGWVVLVQFALFLLLGVGLACFYQGRSFARSDAVFAHFIVTELPPGVVGLTLAAVFAAAMSTLSSSLNSSAAAAVNDFYLPWRGGETDPRQSLRATRGFTIFFGLVQMGVAIVGQWLEQAVVKSVLSIAAFTTGIILGLFFLATFNRRAGQGAALVALVVGLAGMTAIAFKTELAWPWYAAVGSLGTLAVGAFVGRFEHSGGREEETP